jgi:hypothetical protein
MGSIRSCAPPTSASWKVASGSGRGSPSNSDARAFRIEVGYFFAGLRGNNAFKTTPQQRVLLELARSLMAMADYNIPHPLCQRKRRVALALASGVLVLLYFAAG